MLPIQKNITTVNRFLNQNKVEYIVIHDVGALGQAWANSVYFKNTHRGASAHYFVDRGNIVQVVEDKDGAWHVGDDRPGDRHDVGDLIHNRNSLGIEMCLTPNWKVDGTTRQNTIELVHYLQKKYNVPNEKVVRHYDASGKICPRSMSGNNWAEWKALYKDITASVAPPVDKHGETPETITIKAGDTLWGLSKQYDTSIEEMKRLNDLKDNTIITGQTLRLKEGQKSLSELAKEVMAGKHGNGDERKKSLGGQYDAVQKLVIELYYEEKAAAPKPKPKPSYVGKRVESIHDGELRFYSKPSWNNKNVVGTIKRGWGFPVIVRKLKVGVGEQYEVKNSKGAVYYITASPKFVKVV